MSSLRNTCSRPCNRQENVDSADNLFATLHALNDIAASGWPVVFPVHPRTRAMLRALDAEHLLDALIAEEPYTYERFLALASHAAVLVSDSGGIRRRRRCSGARSSWSGTRPNVPRRSVPSPVWSPRRPSPRETSALLSTVTRTLADLDALPSPFGDGHATERIAEHIRSAVSTARDESA